ncbi:MAG: HDIG domain-containing protein [Gemmatimonadales bacterium]|nr:HDIG domain-containing protein [Gemmatimonadales bacterium]
MPTRTESDRNRPIVDIAGVQFGQRVQDPFLVLAVEHRGIDEPFTVIALGNRTGRIETAPFWLKDLPRISGIVKGDVVQVIGEIAAYRDRRQLKVLSIRVLPKDGIDWWSLMPSVGDLDPYWEAVDRWRGDITRPHLRAVVDLCFSNQDFRAQFEACPASLTAHHAALGGLLRHTAEVAAIARAIARVCQAEVDVVLAGALLHDIGKIEAYRWQGGFDLSEQGALLGPQVLGARMLERMVREAETPPCTDRELALLQHLVLAQADTGDTAGPIRPATLAATALYHADQASARTALCADAIASPDLFQGKAQVSSSHVRQLEGRQVLSGQSDWGLEEPAADKKKGRPSGS